MNLLFAMPQNLSHQLLRSKILALASLLVLGLTVAPQMTLAQSNKNEADQDSTVAYEVSFDQAANHYVNVVVTIADAAEDQEVFMPVWTPGSYLIREYSQHVDSVTASDGNGVAVAIHKTKKNRWQAECEQGTTLKISYRVYCNELTVRTNFVDSQFALLNGAALFLTVEERAKHAHTVALVLPSSWNQSITSLNRDVALGANTFVAKNLDELVDSPFVVGNPAVHPFDVGGTPHYLVNIGDNSLWAGEQAAADVAKIVKVHQDMWGQTPYKRYHFLNVIAESGGGLEHDNSTVMLSSRWSFRDPRRYKSWLGLVSHEFFHTWNVRRLRPQALASYDYEAENYFEELWVAEGVTSYYDDLALTRAKINSSREYLSGLSRQIKTLQTTDGRLRQSLAESSFDAWIKHYRPNENSRNTSISYYNKGAVVAFLLDIEIRSRTKNNQSLDTCMRHLYSEFALKGGYTTADIVKQLESTTDSKWQSWFDQAIYSTDELDYAPALQWLGLTFNHELQAEKRSATSEKSGKTEPIDGPIWTGLSTKSEDGKLIVSAVTENSPAFEAGINVDDEILAVNRYRVSDSLTSRLTQFESDDEAQLLISRRGALIEVTLPIVQRIEKDWRLIPHPDATDEQKANLNAWLHIEPSPEDSEKVKPAEASQSDENQASRNGTKAGEKAEEKGTAKQE